MKLDIIQSIEIEKPIAELQKYLSDLSFMEEWSPWNIFDDNVVININIIDGKQVMDWKGKYNGIGSLTLINSKLNKIEFDLMFLKPMKTKSKTTFYLKKIDENKTQVQWEMKSSMPFFMFFLKKYIVKFVNQDFKRGLLLMKSVLETGKKPFKLEFIDTPVEELGFLFYGIKNSCFLPEIGKIMLKDFETITTKFKENKAKILGSYCFYENVKILSDWFEFVCGFSTNSNFNENQLLHRSIPKHKVVKVILYGDYQYLEHAWAGLMNHTRINKNKRSKIKPYEKYIKGPADTQNRDEFITEICFPVK